MPDLDGDHPDGVHSADDAFQGLVQVVGYLVLENGIFVFGMLLIEAMPFVVEMGVLLDLFVGIFVICIITNHINPAFSSMDTRRLVTLKE